jgi:hypothetical protein
LTVTLSAALLLGVVVFLLYKYAGLKNMARRGVRNPRFYLASTSFVPHISQFTGPRPPAFGGRDNAITVAGGCR